jgi:hypothetical protein
MTSKNVPRAGSLVAAGNATANGVIITNRWLQIDSQIHLERSSRMKHQSSSTSATAHSAMSWPTRISSRSRLRIQAAK